MADRQRQLHVLQDFYLAKPGTAITLVFVLDNDDVQAKDTHVTQTCSLRTGWLVDGWLAE